jgi:hypothetical protein
VLDSEKHDWSNTASNIMMHTILYSFSIGLLFPMLQALQWLKSGIWEIASVHHVLERIQIQLSLNSITWIGIRHVVELLLDFHVSLYLCVIIPGLIICVAVSLQERKTSWGQL